MNHNEQSSLDNEQIIYESPSSPKNKDSSHLEASENEDIKAAESAEEPEESEDIEIHQKPSYVDHPADSGQYPPNSYPPPYPNNSEQYTSPYHQTQIVRRVTYSQHNQLPLFAPVLNPEAQRSVANQPLPYIVKIPLNIPANAENRQRCSHPSREIEKRFGFRAWASCIILYIVCPMCSCIPFCIEDCKENFVVCGECGDRIETC